MCHILVYYKNYTVNSSFVGSAEKDAYTTTKKKNNPVNDIKDPTEAIKFQPA